MQGSLSGRNIRGDHKGNRQGRRSNSGFEVFLGGSEISERGDHGYATLSLSPGYHEDFEGKDTRRRP